MYRYQPLSRDARSDLINDWKHHACLMCLPCKERQIDNMTLVLNKFIDHLKTEAAKADCDKWDVDDYLDKDLEYSVTAPIVTDVNTDTLKQWLRDFTVENNTIDADIEELMELLRCFGYIKKIDKTTYKITLEMYESMQEAVLDLKGRPSRCSGLWKHVQIM